MTIKGLRSGWNPIFQGKFRKFELNKYRLFSKFFQALPIHLIFLQIRIQNDSFSRVKKFGLDRAKKFL